jgi:hypothetical protein
LRPELRLGFPIYLAPKDQVWYIQGISHNIQFGGRAQTNLSLTAKRSKFVAPKGIGTMKLTGYKGQKVAKGKNLTAQQLSSGAHFKAKIGAAAELPPLNLPTKPGVDNPYEPLVLRHPKTGRIVGYPNVVMAYTRPFTPSPAKLADVSGKKDPKAKRPMPQKYKSVETQAPEIEAEQMAKFQTFTNDDKIREKHLANRYSYGLNSAGVYVYLHDESQMIKEILLLPASNVDFGKSVISGKNPQRTGMIRPVSDERGFEVIGHYRYGRGLSLRDGSLVLNETAEKPGATNSKAGVSMQLALSGGMYEMLQAQSQGIGTVKTMYPSPADAVSRLMPEDLQTAATINPQTKEAEFVNTGKTFVDVAPLGSPEQKGALPSIEASQLSRALTLAEMTVKMETGGVENEQCGCILGRPDLAFISVGYQVSVLRDTAEDKSSFSTGSMTTAALATVQQKSAKGEPIKMDATGNALLSKSLEKNSPVLESAYMVDRNTLVSRVDAYLTTLYNALDVSHQEFEAAIRGETLEKQNNTYTDPVNVRFPKPEQWPNNQFAPPFSVPGRAYGGDPRALAKKGSTAIDGMSKSWEEFGGKLRSSAKRAELEGRISQDKSAIYSLKNEQTRLQKAKDANDVSTTIAGGSIDTQLARNAQALDAAQKDLHNNQQKLNDLNQKYPP